MRCIVIRYFLFLATFAATCTASAAPPEVPKEVKARPGQLVRVVAKGDGEIGFTRSFADDDAFFDELAPKPKEKRYVFQSDKPGVYFLAFWTKGETEGSVCIITVGDGKPVVPPVVPPPIKPPVDPPVPPTTSLYFLIVRADGPADPAFTRTMGDPAWDTLRKAGHKAKDRTLAEATKAGFAPATGTRLPVVLILREGADNSELVGTTPFPGDSASILDLPKKAVK